MGIMDQLKSAGIDPNATQQPLWQGPEKDGITFSLLSRFLVCRERFRIRVMEGLAPTDRWNHRTGYGEMWHVCEEAVAGGPPQRVNSQGTWQDYPLVKLREHTQELCRRYSFQQQEIDHWYNVCKVQFPHYVKYWTTHPDIAGRKPLLQETAFRTPYKLPSGRIVNLRGKQDAVDWLPKHTDESGRVYPAGVWLQENKTKGDIDELQLLHQLKFDLQTMLYLIALKWHNEHDAKGKGLPSSKYTFEAPIIGVRYNVVRRPLSGGKGTIKQHEATLGSKCPKCKGTGRVLVAGLICPKCKGAMRIGGKPAETKEHFYERVGQYIQDEPSSYFMRWKIGVSEADITRFRQQCLDPMLESLYDWYEWVKAGDPWRQGNKVHSITPFGLYNPLLEGNSTDVDECLLSGSQVGLRRSTNLFPELT